MIRRGLLVLAATAAFVVPSLPAQAGYACPPGNFADRATTRVDMKGDCFAPVVARVDLGDELTFRNVDSHDHTVGGVAGTFADGHDPIRPGETVTVRFDEAGVYPFFCLIHPGMAGAVVVGDGTATGTSNAVAAPVEPASASGPTETAPASDSPSIATVIVAGVAALVVLAMVSLALRRRRALPTGAQAERL